MFVNNVVIAREISLRWVAKPVALRSGATRFPSIQDTGVCATPAAEGVFVIFMFFRFVLLSGRPPVLTFCN
jgi:hypothetical protein